jgi:hypothetical protein
MIKANTDNRLADALYASIAVLQAHGIHKCDVISFEVM